jgi:hypothetical protein
MVKKKPVLNSLSEEDIRNRLYGSAVGVSSDALGKFTKKEKSVQREVSEADKEHDLDRSKICSELAILRSELIQAKRRLDRIKGVNAKKIRLIIISSVVVFLFILLTAVLFRKIFSYRISRPQAGVSVGKMSYTVQVAVSGKPADAENLKSDLEDKGYKPFIHKSLYTSGKDKFTIYAGSFNDRKSAKETMERLKEREGIKDSFIVNMPE